MYVMIVFTTKLTRRKVISTVLALSIIVCSVAVAIRNGNENETVSVADEQNLIASDVKLKTNEDRVSLLEGYGWIVDKEPLEFMEVRIPEEFDGVYNDYNEIQKRQGMNLEKYSGKRVMRYTYRITNHPSNEEGVVANIIIYKNKLIAGDVCSPKLGGFMHGLAESSETSEMEETEKTPENENKEGQN